MSMKNVWIDPIRNAKISAGATGTNNGMFGKPAVNRGKPHSEETKRKMREAKAKRKAAKLAALLNANPI